MQDRRGKALGDIGKKRLYKENWEKQQIYVYWLTSVEGIGSRTIEKLLQHAGTLKAVYEMNLPDMMEILPQSKAKALINAKTEYDIWERYEKLEKMGICFYSVYHPDYPRRLKNIPDKPYGIYVEGELPEEGIPSIAVIGARQCSSYGRFMAEVCGRELAKAGVNVISGMARGIDGISQKAALDAGGKTYAVLGCGTDICYPPENSDIYIKAKENGAVISEYPPGVPPAPRLFPRRNRIISGLADVALIIEARMKSGTLITADMALEQGKDVYVLPGRITDPLSQGCNQMLKQGAGLFHSVAGLLEETGLLAQISCRKETVCNGQGQQRKTGKLPESKGQGGDEKDSVCRQMQPEGGTAGEDTGLEKRVLNALDFYPKDTDGLIQETRIEYRQLIRILTRLCLAGKASRLSANHFVKRV